MTSYEEAERMYKRAARMVDQPTMQTGNAFGIDSAGTKRKKKQPKHIVLRRLKERLKQDIKSRLAGQIKPINAEVIRACIPDEDESTFFLMNGNCEFADFLAVFRDEIERRGDTVTEMLCTTLSMNEHSFDVLDTFDCMKHVLVSSYFVATDKANVLFEMRKKGRLEGYNIGFFRNHTKLNCLKTKEGHHYVFCGSANLRSSATIEQFTIDNCKATYDFIWRWLHPLIEKYNFEKEADKWQSTPATFYEAL